MRISIIGFARLLELTMIQSAVNGFWTEEAAREEVPLQNRRNAKPRTLKTCLNAANGRPTKVCAQEFRLGWPASCEPTLSARG